MTFGKYIVVEVVSVTAQGSVSTARPVAGGPSTFAIKQLNAPQADPDEPHWEGQHFLDRARVQRSVVASGGRYWAPIHDMGLTAEGAWFVTDYHPLSAQKVIDSRMELHVNELHHIIDSVVRGLVELQQVRRRSHGCLKPSNVLISGTGDLSTAPVLLSDPSQGISEGEPGDLYALGNLIHQLVLHRPFAGGQEWPLQPAEAWNRLSKAGGKWLALCNAMLATQPEARPSLFEVSHQLRELTPKKRIKGSKRNPDLAASAKPKPRRSIKNVKLRKRYLVVPAMAVFLALVCMAALLFAVASARRQVAAAKSGWIDAFAVALNRPERRTLYRSDPDLKLAIDDLDRSRLATMPLHDGLLSDLSLSRLREMRLAAGTVQQLQRELSPAHWRRVADLIALQQKYQSRGWNQPASYLSNLIVAAQPRPGAAVADAIDRIFRVQPLIERDQAQVETQQAELDANARRLDLTRDQLLQAFAHSLRTSAGQYLTLSDAGFQGLDQLTAEVALAHQLVDATRVNFPGNIDTQRLAQDLSSAGDLAHPTSRMMQLWLHNLPLYSLRTVETAVAAGELRRRLKYVDASIVRNGQSPSERDAFEHDRREAEAQINAFAQSHFIEKEFEDGSVAARQKGIAAEVDLLQKYSRPQTAADLVRALPSVSSASKRINDYWDSWKQAQLARKARSRDDDRAQIASLKVRANVLHTTLTDLDRAFPPVPADLSPSYAAVAQKHRDQEITKLLSGIDPQAPQVDALRATSAAASYGEWCATLHKLAQDFPIRKQFVTTDDRPDERWSLQDSFWRDADIQQLVKPDLERLAAVRQLAGAARAALVETARSSKSPELAFEAWRQLGQPRIQPAWPATPQELAAEAQMRGRLQPMLARIADAADRAAVLDSLREQGPSRWRQAVDQADSEAALAAVWGMRGDFGITAAQLDALPPVGRFNLWLWRVRREVAANDDASLQQSIAQLTRAASAMKDQPAAGRVASALSGTSRNQPFAEAQPGDRFKVALMGVLPALEFKRVEPKNGRPFYLSTTAVSMGQFAAVVDAAGAWEQCRQLPWAYLPGRHDLRRGPRVWEWTDGPSPKMAPPQLWLTPEQDNDFAPELRATRFNRMVLSDAAGGMPSGQHPMQQISAEAALWFANLCGCRLPTSREWLIAYEQFEKTVPSAQWNLRDRTWEIQREYASNGRTSLGSGQSPEDGAFRSDEFMAASLGRDVRAVPETDGTLFFRPVGSPGGAVFPQLIGNVAQYVCDAREHFEALPERSAPEAIVDFLRRSPRSLFVIGGSALSPPELPVNKPLAVTRPDQGYADVGFRLAFTAPARSLSERVKWALEGQPYLWPVRQ